LPELPEVETVARGLSRRVCGLVIASIDLRRPEIIHGDGGPIERLVGCRIDDVRRCGKQVRIMLRPHADRPAPTMYVHLGMTGRLVAVDGTEPLESHTHLRVTFRQAATEMRFCDPRRFGGVWLVCGDGDSRGKRWVGRRLPPIAADPLQLSLAQMREVLDRRRQIKALLLDQQPISGLGNIYCDELLHRAGVHPLTIAADLDPAAVRRVYQAMRRVLDEAIRAGGSSVSDYRNADNTRGSFQRRHRVYGRAGQACRRCGCTIERLVVAGRGTYVCPACQPLQGGKRRPKGV
jgi:formamidopyrimidine-DNA glycosylase